MGNGGAGSPGQRSVGLDTPTQQAAPPPTGPRRDSHHTSLFSGTLTVMLELQEPRGSYARGGPGPPGSFGLVVCPQSSQGIQLDKKVVVGIRQTL